MNNLQLITRELINEMLTPEEEREWMTHNAHLPKEEMEEAREHLLSASVITQALVQLMNAGAKPEDEAVQKLLMQNNQLTQRYRLRERLARRGNWNETIAKKVHALGMRLVLKTATPVDGSIPESKVLEFCSRAHKVSKWGQALDEISAEAAMLCDRGAEAHSNSAQALAQRYIEVCRRYSLGDPTVYGRWFVQFAKVLVDGAWVPVNERQRGAWALLLDAVEASRQPAGLRTAAAW